MFRIGRSPRSQCARRASAAPSGESCRSSGRSTGGSLKRLSIHSESMIAIAPEIVAAYDQRVAADVVATTDATWVHATKLAALAKDTAR